MELMLILTYTALCWGIFKVFKISVNKWSMTTAILGGVVLMAVSLAGMAYFHPASVTARSYFVTTPIVANVRAKVIEVPVKPNAPLKKGDILCILDPTTYQARLDNIRAQYDFANKRLAQTRSLVEASAGSQFDVDQYETELESLENQLIEAEFNLESTIVRAPTDGFVTHVRLRPGMMAVPLPLSPIMTFVHTDEPVFVAGFSQQPMQNIKVGYDAEVLFPGIPGRVFKGRVSKILDVIAEGQLAPSSSLLSVDPKSPEGLIPVFIEFEEDMSEFYLPMGSAGMVAVYSERWQHVGAMRKVLFRMKSWQNFAVFH